MSAAGIALALYICASGANMPARGGCHAAAQYRAPYRPLYRNRHRRSGGGPQPGSRGLDRPRARGEAPVAATLAAGIATAQVRAEKPGGQSLARAERGAGVIEGKLTRVDGRTETVDVSIGPLSLLGKTLEVRSDTMIHVDGREARFADLQEGAKVKAFYEERGAKLVATRIEVTSCEARSR